MDLRSLVEVLRFRESGDGRLKNLSDPDWQRLIKLADRAQLTFPLDDRYRELMPSEIREYIATSAAHNGERNRRFQSAYREIACRLEERGIGHVVLKGFSHCPNFCPDLTRRLQVDIDLWVPRKDIRAAGGIAAELGYEPLEGMERFPVDHLPTMLRRTGWTFRGDTYDPEIPPRLEIHFQLWDRATERFEPGGLGDFWDRRVTESIDGHTYPALRLEDRLAYACLHLLRHVLRGRVRPSHVYEIGWFLHSTAEDTAFWRSWRELHPPSLIAAQAIVFGIVREWFACDLAPEAEAAVCELNSAIRDWIRDHAFAPIDPTKKSELWLHLQLVHGFRDRAAIVRRRLLPVQIPRPTVGVEIPIGERPVGLRVRMKWTQVTKMFERAIHHARGLPPVIAEGFRYWSRSREISGSYWTFLFAACIFETGLLVFVLLYNLYLLGIGFEERAIGVFTSAFRIGSLAGILPAGYLLRRNAPNRVLAGCFLGVGATFALRSALTDQSMLTATAFLSGAVLSLWAVSIPPTIAQLAAGRGRPTAFSLFAGSGIALGVVAGPLGANTPKWLGSLSLPNPTQTALFAACAIIVTAAWPVSRLRLKAAAKRESSHTPSPFLTRFLIAVTVGSFATGLFNPFFNVYFARHLHFTTEQIGWAFSISQFLQVAAILASPVLFRRIGLTNGIALTQALAASALFALASGAAPLAVPAYAAFMMFQYMNEPGLFTLMVDRVPPENHGGASARYFFFTHGADALAAAAAGEAFARFGYPPTLVVAAFGVLAGAILFRALVASTRQTSS